MRDPSAIENYPPPEARRGRSTEPSSVPRSPRQLAAAAAVGVAMDGGGAAPPDAARSTSPAPMMAAAPAGISTFLQPFFLPPSHQIHVFLSSCRFAGYLGGDDLFCLVLLKFAWPPGSYIAESLNFFKSAAHPHLLSFPFSFYCIFCH